MKRDVRDQGPSALWEEGNRDAGSASAMSALHRQLFTCIAVRIIRADLRCLAGSRALGSTVCLVFFLLDVRERCHLTHGSANERTN